MEKILTNYDDGLKLRYVENKNSGIVVMNITDFKIMKERMERLEEKHRWIPVAGQLPEVGVQVLITTGDGEVEADFLEKPGVWFWGQEEYTAVAWMSLPEPYKPVN